MRQSTFLVVGRGGGRFVHAPAPSRREPTARPGQLSGVSTVSTRHTVTSKMAATPQRPASIVIPDARKRILWWDGPGNRVNGGMTHLCATSGTCGLVPDGENPR